MDEISFKIKCSEIIFRNSGNKINRSSYWCRIIETIGGGEDIEYIIEYSFQYATYKITFYTDDEKRFLLKLLVGEDFLS